jgi:hypothetical protein
MATYSADQAVEAYDHYSDNAAGTANNVSDNNLNEVADANIQNFSYNAIDLGAGNEQAIVRIRFYFYNGFAPPYIMRANAFFQGSNNSTDGTDGDWTNLVELDELTVPGAYPGWTSWEIFANTTQYQWYRNSGCLPNNNTVLVEWELTYDLDAPVGGGQLAGHGYGFIGSGCYGSAQAV